MYIIFKRLAKADLRLCWSHISHCWKSRVAAQLWFTLWVLISISVVRCRPLQTVCTKTRPHKSLGLIWIQTVWHSDDISEIEKGDFWRRKILRRRQKYANYNVPINSLQLLLGLISVALGMEQEQEKEQDLSENWTDGFPSAKCHANTAVHMHA